MTEQYTREQRIGHISKKLSYAKEFENWRIDLAVDELDFLISEIYRLQQERDKAIEGLTGAVAELDRLGAAAWNKWEKEADMHAQGEADAYDIAEQMVEAVLSDLGVSL